MGRKKLTKAQKRKIRKRRKFLKRRKNATKNIQKLKPWEAPKMKMFKMPQIFPENLTLEQRREIVRSIGRRAQELFEQRYPALENWFKNYDALYLLSFCLCYFCTYPEGIFPEAEGHLEFYPHFLEILQAFALMQRRSYSPKPLFEDTQHFIQEIKDVGEAIQFRFFKDVETINDDELLHAQELRHNIMMATIAVRNWAYSYQMKRVTADLAKLVRLRFKETYGLDPERIIYLLFDIVDHSEKRLNDHRCKLRKLFKANTVEELMITYNTIFPDTVPIIDEDAQQLYDMAGKNLKNLRAFFICHSDLRLESIYTFTIDEICEIYGDTSKTKELQHLFDLWSLSFEQLKGFNKEYVILDNPVHRKPFIKLQDGNYYSSLFGLLPHISISLLENLISIEKDWKEDYSSNIKPYYVEDRVEQLIKHYFPSGTVLRGSMWFDPDTNESYENDLTLVLDNFAIVLESKSGTFSRSARRGAPQRLSRTLRILIEKPSIQAMRFIEFLKSNRVQHKFRTQRGVVNLLDSSKIEYFIPIGVTLEEIGTVGSNIKKLIDAGIVKKTIGELDNM